MVDKKEERQEVNAIVFIERTNEIPGRIVRDLLPVKGIADAD
jgi:hypothetical protein